MKNPQKIVGWSAQIRINGVETLVTVQAEDKLDAKRSIEKVLSVGNPSLLNVHGTEMVSRGSSQLAGLEEYDMDLSKLAHEPMVKNG